MTDTYQQLLRLITPSKAKASTKEVGFRFHSFAIGATLLVGLGVGGMTLKGMDWDSIHSYADFKTQFEDNLVTRKASIEIVNGSRYRFLGAADDQVQFGRDGWIYLSQELHEQPLKTQNWQTRAQAVVDLERGFAKRGIKLVLAVVPAKARIHPEHLPGGSLPSYMQPGYSEFMDSLEHSGVTVVKMDKVLREAALKQEVFYHTDTHWNQAGAKIGAEQVAKVIQGLGLELPQTHYQTQVAGPKQERVGDLVNLMSLNHVPAPWRPAGDSEAPVKTEAVGDSNMGLLGEPTSQVVLVGTSYSLRGNFQGYLQQALHSPVINLAKEGSGFVKSMNTYLQDPSIRENPPKVVIWEFSERFLYLPIDGKMPSWKE